MDWLQRGRIAALQPGPPPVESALAVRAWNMLGGLDWAGLDQVAEILGIEDKEALVNQLVVIREFKASCRG